MKNKDNESKIYFEEPSQIAQSIASSPDWQKVVDEQTAARLTLLGRIAAAFSPDHVNQLRSMVAREAAARKEAEK
ncbi:hypothetical protein HY623_00235 [Candidatus Uhrbacteria bacterium]|nr:hypothetical protein [Candidatus Uhrbacteria bacterium]